MTRRRSYDRRRGYDHRRRGAYGRGYGRHDRHHGYGRRGHGHNTSPFTRLWTSLALWAIVIYAVVNGLVEFSGK